MSLLGALGGFAFHTQKAYAATSSTVNFQARLEGSGGAIAPDGTYNVEFKLYNASGTGTALWTEDYVNSASQGIKVVNGYVTANLGSITAFSGINWDQPLWITMNIGGTTTGTPSWDGEMSPRLQLTAVPYAFTAGQLATSGSSYRSTLAIQAPTVGNQNFVIQDQGAAGTYNILTTASGSDGYLKLQGGTPGTTQTGSFNINGTGIVSNLLTGTLDSVSGGTISVGLNNASAVNLGNTSYNNTVTVGSVQSGSKLYLQGGDSGINLLSSGIVMNGATYALKVGGSTALAIDSSGNISTANSITAGSLRAPSLDTASAGTLAIGTSNATTLNLGTNNASHTVNVATGSGVQAVTVGSATSSSSTVIQGGSGGVAFNTNGSGWYNFNLGGSSAFSINGGSGAAVFKPLSDFSGAFQIQSSTGGTAFSVDTSANQVQTGTTGSLLVGSGGISNNGGLTLTGTAATSYTTPGGTSIDTKINIPNYDPGAFSQIIALGLPSSANSTARAITLLDARTAAHQPTIAVLSPNESDIFGLSWDGSNSTALLKSSANNIGLQVGGVTALTATNSSGTGVVSVNGGLQVGASSQFQVNSSGNLVSSGSALINKSSATAFQVQNGSSTPIFTVDTTSDTLSVGNASTDTGHITLYRGGSAYGVTIVSALQTGNYTLSIPVLAANDTLCTLGNGCGSVNLQGGTPGTAQTGNINISGTAIAGLLQAASLDTTSAGTLSIGAANATTITIGGTNAIKFGSSAGGGSVVTNNGATINSVLALGNYATGGSIGTAASTVDIYTSVSISQTTANQTLTLPAPSASTIYGRLLYVSNIGTASFMLLGTSLSAGASGTLVWSNTNGGASWVYSGADGNSILNQTSSVQTASFKITGNATVGQLVVTAGTNTFSSTGGSTFQLRDGNNEKYFIGSTTSTNLIGWSPTFENGITGWNVDGSGTGLAVSTNSTLANVYSGINSMKIITASGTANTGAQQATFNIALSSSTQYTLSFYAKSGSGTVNTLRAGMAYNGSTETACSLSSTSVLASGFQRYTCTFTTGTIASPYIFIGTSDTAQSTLYIDNAQLIAGATATAVGVGAIDVVGVVSSPLTIQNNSDSTGAFQVMNAAGTTTAFGVDTLNNKVNIGGSLSLNGGVSLTNSSYNQSSGDFTYASSSGLMQMTVSAFALTGGTNPLILATNNNNTNMLYGNTGFESASTTTWSQEGASQSISVTGAPVYGNPTATAPNIYEGRWSGVVTTSSTTANTGIKSTSFSPAPTSSTSYTLSFYAKASGSNFSTLRAGMAYNGSTETACTLNSSTVLTTGFQRYSCSFTSGTISGSPYIFIGVSDTTQHIFYLDDVQLSANASLTPYDAGSIALTGRLIAPATFQNQSDSTTALQIQNAAGTSNLFNADTLNGVISIGGKLCVNSSSCTNTLGVTGNIGASGSITASTTPDLAETIAAAPDVTAADVVMADPNATERVVKASGAYASSALGVISDGTSSFMINAHGYSESVGLTGKPLVLAGRVPVKVSNENGAIKPGDYLTTSATLPGYAMKATQAGATIGKSLGFFDASSGTVLVFVNLSYYNPTSGAALQGSDANFSSLNVSGDANIGGNLTVHGVTHLTDVEVAGHIITSGNAPTFAALTAAGQNAVVSISGNDTSGTITITTGDPHQAATGSTPEVLAPTAGDILQVTFAKQFGATPRIMLSPADKDSAAMLPYPSATNSSGFSLGITALPGAQQTYRFSYWIVQ